jgi:hypothetical protein
MVCWGEMMELHEAVGQVQTRADVIAFVRVLSEDLAKNRGSWENATLERFLAALASWLEDCDAYYQKQGRSAPEELSWRDLADLLMAAKIYE